MTNISSYLLANAYSAFSPAANLANATCTSNGEIVPCSPAFDALGMGFIAFMIALVLIMFISIWKIFTKAGKPGWASIIPIYNTVVILEIAKKPVWWVILMFIPFVNILIWFIVLNEVSKAFGKGVGFTLGLIFLPFIFYPILGFGSAQYTGGQVIPMQTI